jgi:chromosome segregation ATPase
MSSSGARACWLGALMLMAATHTLAGESNREREALRRVQQSLRDAQAQLSTAADEKATLSAEKAKLEDSLKQAQGKASSTASQLTAARGQASRLQTELDAQKTALDEARVRESALNEQLQQLQSRLSDQMRLTRTLQAMLSDRTHDVQVLTSQNEALYRTGLDLIDLYRSQSPSAWLKARDQLLGFHEVKVENLAEAMRDRLDDARYKALPGEATAAGPAPAPANAP